MSGPPDFTLTRLYPGGGLVTAHTPEAVRWLEDRYPGTGPDRAAGSRETLALRYAEGVRGVDFTDPGEVVAYLENAGDGFAVAYVDRVGAGR